MFHHQMSIVYQLTKNIYENLSVAGMCWHKDAYLCVYVFLLSPIYYLQSFLCFYIFELPW